MGVAAYLFGFGTSCVLVSTRLSELHAATVSTESSAFTLAELAQSAHASVWKWAGLAFYSSHATDVTISGLPVDVRESTQQVNLLTEAGGVFSALLAVTPVVFVVAGALATRNATDPTKLRFDVFGTGKNRFFVNAGLVVFFGYLPLAILGSILSSVSLDGNVVIRTDLLESIVAVGTIYPFVFGRLGGCLRSYFA